MTATRSGAHTITQAELCDQARTRFGEECIGRSLGALTKDALGTDGRAHAKRGCDWAAYGLFSGPWLIEIPDGDDATKTVPSFALASRPATEETPK